MFGIAVIPVIKTALARSNIGWTNHNYRSLITNAGCTVASLSIIHSTAKGQPHLCGVLPFGFAKTVEGIAPHFAPPMF